MVSQRSVRFSLTTSHTGFKKHGDQNLCDVEKRLSTTSQQTLGCQNQGNPTPCDLARGALNTVRSFQTNKSCRICVVMTLLVMLSTPTLGAAGESSAEALEKLLMEANEITKDTFLNFIQEDDGKRARRRDQVVTQIFVWLGQTTAYKEKMKSCGLTTCGDWLALPDDKIAQGALNYFEMVEHALDVRSKAEWQKAKEIRLQALRVLRQGVRKLSDADKKKWRLEIEKDLSDLVKDDHPPKPKFKPAPLSSTARDTLEDLYAMPGDFMRSQRSLHRRATSAASPCSDSSNGTVETRGSRDPQGDGTRR